MATGKRTAKKATKKAAAKKAAAATPTLDDAAEDVTGLPGKDTDAALAQLDEQMGEPLDVTTDGPGTPPDGAQDVLVDLGAAASTSARTALGAIRWAWGEVKSDADDYEGLCLRFVRLAFNVDALYPDAITAWAEADRKWRTDAAGEVKRGHAVFWRGGDHGHVALAVGRGLCISTDVRTPGQANLVRIAAIREAWGYELLGYTADVNGVVAPRIVAPRPRVSTREWRIRRLRQAVSTARKNGNDKAAAKLHAWLRELRDRQAAAESR